MSERPNYFILLKLDPSVDDWPTIEKQLRESQQRWSSVASMGNPAERRAAARNLQMLSNMRKVLADGETRREEARNARKLLNQEKLDATARLRDHLDILRAKGRCQASEVWKIVKDLGGHIDEKEVRAAILAAKIPIAEAAPARAGAKQRARIDPVTQRNIRHNLNLLRLQSLYAFLELAPRSSVKALCERADRINRDILRRGGTDVHSNARKELAGICMSVFKTEREKAKYDNTLATDKMEQLHSLMESAGHDGVIGQEAMELLVAKAQGLGISAEAAGDYIADYASKRKWALPQGQQAPVSQVAIKVCGYCATLASSRDATHCTACGEPLDIECPRCRSSGPTTASRCSKCGFNIGDAPHVKGLVAEAAKQLERGEIAAAVDHCEEALALWPEHAEALKIKARAEPPPRRLTVREVDAGFQLNWEGPGSATDIRFRVLRKRGSLPTHWQDGEVLGEIEGNAFDDVAAEPGVPWSYAVYSLRSGVCSSQAAMSGPHLRIAEITLTTERYGNGRVSLKWNRPRGCREVRVWRRRGPSPNRPGEGQQLAVTNDSIVDEGLINGMVYGYLLVAVFPDPADPSRERLSRGVRRNLTPTPPPSPVTDLQCQCEKEIATLSWTPIENAEVQILQIVGPLPSALSNSDPPKMVDLDRMGKWVDPSRRGGAVVSLKPGGINWFVPVSIGTNTVISIGRATKAMSVPSVANVKIVNQGEGRVELAWDWPQGVEQALVCWDTRREPTKPDMRGSSHFLIERSEYLHHRTSLIEGLEKRPHYVAVFAKAADSDDFSDAKTIYAHMGQRSTIRYAVTHKKKLFSKTIIGLELNLRTNDDLWRIPPFEVRGAKGAPPQSNGSGKRIEKFSAKEFINGARNLELNFDFSGSGLYVALFFVNELDNQRIRFEPDSDVDRIRL